MTIFCTEWLHVSFSSVTTVLRVTKGDCISCLNSCGEACGNCANRKLFQHAVANGDNFTDVL